MKDQEIDFNIEIRQLGTKDKLEGDIIPGNVPQAIGNLLLNNTFIEEPNELRKLHLAERIATGEKVMMNKPDFDLVIKAIKNPKTGIPVLHRARLLEKLTLIKWEA